MVAAAIDVAAAAAVMMIDVMVMARSAARAPPVAMAAVPMGMMIPAPAVVAPAEAEAHPAHGRAPADVEAPAEAQGVGNAEAEGGRPGIIVGADPGRVAVAGPVNYDAVVDIAANVAGIVAHVNVIWSVVVNPDVAHMIDRVSRGNGVDDAGHVDADFPAGQRIEGFVPDRVFAEIVAVVDPDDVVGSVDGVSHGIGFRDLLELRSAVIDHFRNFLRLAGDFDGLGNVGFLHRFLGFLRAFDGSQRAFLAVFLRHLVEAGGQLVGRDVLPFAVFHVTVPAAGQKHVKPGIGGAVEEIVLGVLRIHDVGAFHVLVNGSAVEGDKLGWFRRHDDLGETVFQNVVETFLLIVGQFQAGAVFLDGVGHAGSRRESALQRGSGQPVGAAFKVIALPLGVEDQAVWGVGHRLEFALAVKIAHDGGAVDLHQDRGVRNAEDLGGIVLQLAFVPGLVSFLLLQVQDVIQIQDHIHLGKFGLERRGVGDFLVLLVGAFEFGDPKAVAGNLAVDRVVAGKSRQPNRAVNGLGFAFLGLLDGHRRAEPQIVVSEKFNAGFEDLKDRIAGLDLAGPV